MASADNSAGTPAREPELTLTRTLNAPRKLVWRAWTEPEQLAQWFAPRGWRIENCKIDLRVGGTVSFEMHGPAGEMHGATGEYREVVPPERLAFASAVPDASGKPLFEVLHTATLVERDGKTELTLTAHVLSQTPEAAPYIGGMAEGWGQTLDKLGELVDFEDAAQSGREIRLSRSYDAPRELVWRAFTTPAILDQWWGPDGFSNTTLEFDLRPGGRWRHIMHGPDGRDYPNRMTYVEIIPQQRLVYTNGWDDDAIPPMFKAAVTFEERGRKTEVTMRNVFPTAAERDEVVEKVGAIEGGKQTLARLAEWLKGNP